MTLVCMLPTYLHMTPFPDRWESRYIAENTMYKPSDYSEFVEELTEDGQTGGYKIRLCPSGGVKIQKNLTLLESAFNL